MDIFLIVLLIAVPAFIVGLVAYVGIRDRRSRRNPFDDAEITTQSMREVEAEAAARAAGTSRVTPF